MAALYAVTAFSQSGFYVPKKGKIFFSGDTATVFSDVTNGGKVGVGKNAVVNFSGTVWTNAPDAAIINESDTTLGAAGTGGLVRFIGTQRQKLDAGYNAAVKTGAVFQQFELDNPYGLELTGSSAKVSREIALSRGLFFLNDQMLVTGDENGPGVIKGYDSSRYFVTNTRAGLLIREGIATYHDWIAFPIGSKARGYTPLALRTNAETKDDYYASVFDSVYGGGTSGASLMNEGVGKTWQAGRRFFPGEGNVEIALQHLNADEGAVFTANKTKAYVSQIVGGKWDVDYPQTHPGPGYITTSLPYQNSGVNSRTFSSLMSVAYFTKLTGAGDTSRTRLWFNAYRLNPSNVKVYWTTNPEINVRYFVVQRRLANETVFKNIDTVDSKALNGYSSQPLYYEMTDPNGYTGVSFYRLMSVQYSRDSAYSQIVAVGNKTGEFNIDLWPNPTTGIFYIALNTAQPVKKIIIWDEIGQKVMEQETNGQRVVQVNAFKLPQAHYFVSLVGDLDRIIATKKLVVVR